MNIPGTGKYRRAADPSGIIGNVPIQFEVKNLIPFQEKGPFFFIEGFKGSQVQYRGICLHLTKIRIDGEVEGVITADPHLGVNTSIEFKSIHSPIIHIFLIGGKHIGQQLHLPRTSDVLHPF